MFLAIIGCLDDKPTTNLTDEELIELNQKLAGEFLAMETVYNK